MGFRYYKRVNLGGGLKLNLSKTGIGVSAGVPGLRYSVHSSGRTVKTAGIPGTGIYYRKDTYAKGSGSRSSARSSRTRPTAPALAMYPKAGLLAPKEHKAFVKGVTAYMQGQHAAALNLFRTATSRDEAGTHVSELLFAALCLIALNRADEAIVPLQEVIASPSELPDGLMTKYGVTGQVQVQITPQVVGQLPMSQASAALLLAEILQHSGRTGDAAELLETMGSHAPDPIIALSLADLYAELGRWDDLARVTEDFTTNEGDGFAQLLTYRAQALREKGLKEASLQVLKEVLRFRKRNSEILREARYQRALAYDALGRKAQARKDFERIYAEAPAYRDVSERLGQGHPGFASNREGKPT
jgi:tetratricopeptide (TPR) repeat protein